jgi:hypothetical protein
MAHDLGLDAHPSPTRQRDTLAFETKLEFLLREIYFYGTYLIERPFLRLLGLVKAWLFNCQIVMLRADTSIRRRNNP